MMKFLLCLLLTFSTAQAFTLNNNFAASFKNNKVKVFVDAGTVCPTNQVTVNDLESLVGPAINDFWNKVPTSNLELDSGGFSQAVPAMNHGRLCSPTDDDCLTEGTSDPNGLIPPIKDIVIACNDNPSNFDGTNVLAVTIPNNFSGKKIAGAVIVINDNSNAFGSLSREDQIAVIAHEIGHAIGLGHAEDKAALMYYRTVNLRKNLGQDDIDGVSYLYPMQIDGFGLLGGCGTITDGKNPPVDPPFSQMLITLGLFILLMNVWKLLRSKTRTTA